jgi:7-carboxy-7-deazaguanine synthase
MKISEIFYSVQGEGIEIGMPTVFVRLFACDLRCSWCDTMYAVEGRDFKEVPVAGVIEQVEKWDCMRVCITGGEPLIQHQEVSELAAELIEMDYNILLETSGHKMPPAVFWTEKCVISMDCKCPGSGMHERMDYTLYSKLRSGDQLKFVIQDEVDFEYAVNILDRHRIKAHIIFQPAGGLGVGWITEKVMSDNLSGVRVLPQLHKIIWGDKRGV